MIPLFHDARYIVLAQDLLKNGVICTEKDKSKTLRLDARLLSFPVRDCFPILTTYRHSESVLNRITRNLLNYFNNDFNVPAMLNSAMNNLNNFSVKLKLTDRDFCIDSFTLNIVCQKNKDVDFYSSKDQDTISKMDVVFTCDRVNFEYIPYQLYMFSVISAYFSERFNFERRNISIFYADIYLDNFLKRSNLIEISNASAYPPSPNLTLIKENGYYTDVQINPYPDYAIKKG